MRHIVANADFHDVFFLFSGGFSEQKRGQTLVTMLLLRDVSLPVIDREMISFCKNARVKKGEGVSMIMNLVKEGGRGKNARGNRRLRKEDGRERNKMGKG